MTNLQELIEALSSRAADSDLLALLATTSQRRIYNADLARELRDVIEALRREIDQEQAPALRQPDEIRPGSPKN